MQDHIKKTSQAKKSQSLTQIARHQPDPDTLINNQYISFNDINSQYAHYQNSSTQ